MEMMAQSAGFDFDENVERRIRKAYGKVDGNTTVAEYLGLDGSDEEERLQRLLRECVLSRRY